jgi:hypothetical protein
MPTLAIRNILLLAIFFGTFTVANAQNHCVVPIVSS